MVVPIGACSALAGVKDFTGAGDAGEQESAPGEAGQQARDAGEAGDDTGDGGCAASTLAWSPTALAGLVLWLDATQLSVAPGYPVLHWPDGSPMHNDASQTMGTAYEPVFEADGIGTRPALHFNGETSFFRVADSPSLQWSTDDYVILVVARFTVTPQLDIADQMLFQKTAGEGPWSGVNLFVNSDKPRFQTSVTHQVSQFSYATSNDAGLDDVPHVFGGRRTGTTLEVRVDGASAGQVPVSPIVDVSVPGRDLMIGQNGYDPRPGFESLDGEIAEILAVRGTLSSDDLHTLECHLLLKYGL